MSEENVAALRALFQQFARGDFSSYEELAQLGGFDLLRRHPDAD